MIPADQNPRELTRFDGAIPWCVSIRVDSVHCPKHSAYQPSQHWREPFSDYPASHFTELIASQPAPSKCSWLTTRCDRTHCAYSRRGPASLCNYAFRAAGSAGPPTALGTRDSDPLARRSASLLQYNSCGGLHAASRYRQYRFYDLVLQPGDVDDARPSLLLWRAGGAQERPGHHDPEFRFHGLDDCHLVHLWIFFMLQRGLARCNRQLSQRLSARNWPQHAIAK